MPEKKKSSAKKIFEKIKSAVKKKKPALEEIKLPEPKLPKAYSEKEMEEYLSPTHEIDLKLQKHLDGLPKDYVLLAVIKVQDYSATNTELIKYFVKKKIPGVFVSVNKPLEDIKMEVPEEYLGQDGIAFIDCISRTSGAEELKGKDFYYLDSANNLVDLSVAMENLVKEIKSPEKFVLVDSLSTLLIYNKPNVVEKFVHSIAGKMRTWKVKAIFIMVDTGESKSIAGTLGQFCDKVIEIE